MNAKDTQKWAKQFARDLKGPLGSIPLFHVMLNHCDAITKIRSTGASWPQIARLMTQLGVASKRGAVISPQQWAATYSNVVKKHKALSPKQLTTGQERYSSNPNLDDLNLYSSKQQQVKLSRHIPRNNLLNRIERVRTTRAHASATKHSHPIKMSE